MASTSRFDTGVAGFPARLMASVASAPWFRDVALAAMCVIVVAVLRWSTAQNVDVSLGLTLAERWLAGARFGIDIIEINPPGFLALYVPAILLGQLTGIRAELGVEATVTALTVGSLWMFVRLLLRAGVISDDARAPLLLLLTTLFLIICAHNFAQREHFGVLFLLPWLTMIASRVDGRDRSTPQERIASGVMLGLALVAKPQFVVCIGCVGLWALYRLRALKPLLSLDTGAAAIVASIYVGLVLFGTPAYVSDVVPMAARLYSGSWSDAYPSTLALALIAAGHVVGLAVPYAVARWFASDAPDRSVLTTLGLVACGGLATFIAQGRGAPYQLLSVTLPLIAAAVLFTFGRVAALLAHVTAVGIIASLALAIAFQIGMSGAFLLLLVALAPVLVLARSAADTWRPWLLLCLLLPGLLFARGFLASGKIIDRATIAAVIKPLAPKPIIGLLDRDLQYAFPLVRDVGGRWVQRDAGLWAPLGVTRLMATHPTPGRRALLHATDIAARIRLRDDFIANPPHVILVVEGQTEDWLDWARRDVRFASFLDAYVPAHRFGDLILLTRKP